MEKMRKPLFLLLISMLVLGYTSKAQYVEPERDDTIRLYAKTPFDSIAAAKALARGSATIKGVAFKRIMVTRGNWKTILGSKITIKLYPVTPYLLEYLKLRKKQNREKLQFVYMHAAPYYYHLEAITNSKGEFTFPYLKPGKYYLETDLGYRRTTHYGYHPDDYTYSDYTKHLDKFVEIKSTNEVKTIKLKN